MVDVITHDPKDLEKMKVTTLADPETLCRVTRRISSGCLSLDHILGGNNETGWGWPVRRVVEVYGDSQAGKSMLATEMSGETMRAGGIAAYADTEIAQDPERMEVLGVAPKGLLMCYPNTVDGVVNYLREFIEYKNKKIGKAAPLSFVWDSVAAIATQAELEKGEEEGTEGKGYPDVPRAISKTLRQIVSEIADNNVLFFLTNQTRQKLGQMFTDGVVTTGGNAIRFYASVRLEVQTIGKIKDEAKRKIIGSQVQATTVKNRLAIPYQVTKLPVYFKYGINEADATFEYLLDNKLIVQKEKGSPWYTVPDLKLDKAFMKKEWTQIFIDNVDAITTLVEGVAA